MFFLFSSHLVFNSVDVDFLDAGNIVGSGGSVGDVAIVVVKKKIMLMLPITFLHPCSLMFKCITCLFSV